jgi:hypothetical protein
MDPFVARMPLHKSLLRIWSIGARTIGHQQQSTVAISRNLKELKMLMTLSKEEVLSYNRHFIIHEVGMSGQQKLKARAMLNR